MSNHRSAALALLGVGALCFRAALAQDGAPNCVQLHNDVQMEQKFVDPQGHEAVRAVTPAKVIPGTVMIYTITAHNSCKGQNTCKGQGWNAKKSEAECKSAGGTVLK